MPSNFNRLLGLSFVVLSTSGCNLIFGIQEGELSGGSGGGATTSTSTTSVGGGGTGATTTVGSGGQGGSGGQIPSATCTALAPFDAISSIDVPGAVFDGEGIASAALPGENRVHVALRASSNQIVARTVRVQTVPDLSPVVVYPSPADGANRRIGGAYVTQDHLHVYGFQDNIPGEWVFLAASEIGDPNVTFAPYPLPNTCQEMRALSVHVAPDGIVRYAGSCLTNNVPQLALMFGGRIDGVAPTFVVGPAALTSGGEIPPDLMVRVYAFLSGNNVILADADDLQDSQPALRWGVTAADLTPFTPINPPPNQALYFFGGPHGPNDKLFLAAIHIDPSTITSMNPEGGYVTGLVGAGDLGPFVSDPVGTLGHDVDFASLDSVAPPFSIQKNGAEYIGGAVSNFDISQPTRVRHFLWGADGTPLVFGFPVFEAPMNVQILAATSAPAGFGNSLSVWTEFGNGEYKVRAARVQCTVQ